MQLILNTTPLKLAGINGSSVNDGDGVRFVIFTQGCPHRCEDCHNEHTWDFDGGSEVSLNYILEQIAFAKLNGVSGITLSGGEPFSQEEACYLIAREAHKMDLSVWTYTGYIYEDLRDARRQHALLDVTDVLVDGPYVKMLHTGLHTYVGSSNQRIINLKLGRETGQVRLITGQVISVPNDGGIINE